MDNLQIYLLLSSLLFSLGIYAVISRQNAVAILMGIELVLNSANINFIAFNRFTSTLNHLDGHIFGLLVIVLAAAEAAVALAIIINIYNNMNTINVDDAAELKQ